MALTNKVILIGRTGDEIVMHHFEDGGSIGRVSLATSNSYTNKSTGEKVTETEWHNLVFRNGAAKVVEEYLLKGDMIAVEGSIKSRQWQDAEGTTRYTTEINVSDFTLLPNKRD